MKISFVNIQPVCPSGRQVHEQVGRVELWRGAVGDGHPGGAALPRLV